MRLPAITIIVMSVLVMVNSFSNCLIFCSPKYRSPTVDLAWVSFLKVVSSWKLSPLLIILLSFRKGHNEKEGSH